MAKPRTLYGLCRLRPSRARHGRGTRDLEVEAGRASPAANRDRERETDRLGDDRVRRRLGGRFRRSASLRGSAN